MYIKVEVRSNLLYKETLANYAMSLPQNRKKIIKTILKEKESEPGLMA